MFEKMSLLIQKKFGPQTYIYNIFMDTNTDHFTLLALRVQGNKMANETEMACAGKFHLIVSH